MIRSSLFKPLNRACNVYSTISCISSSVIRINHNFYSTSTNKTTSSSTNKKNINKKVKDDIIFDEEVETFYKNVLSDNPVDDNTFVLGDQLMSTTLQPLTSQELMGYKSLLDSIIADTDDLSKSTLNNKTRDEQSKIELDKNLMKLLNDEYKVDGQEDVKRGEELTIDSMGIKRLTKHLVMNGQVDVAIEHFKVLAKNVNESKQHQDDVNHVFNLILKYYVYAGQYNMSTQFFLDHIQLCQSFINSLAMIEYMDILHGIDIEMKVLRSLFSDPTDKKTIKQQTIYSMISKYLSWGASDTVVDDVLVQAMVDKLPDRVSQDANEQLVRIALGTNSRLYIGRWTRSMLVSRGYQPQPALLQMLVSHFLAKGANRDEVKRILTPQIKRHDQIVTIILYNTLTPSIPNNILIQIVMELAGDQGPALAASVVEFLLNADLYTLALDWYANHVLHANYYPLPTMLQHFVNYHERRDTNVDIQLTNFWKEQIKHLDYYPETITRSEKYAYDLLRRREAPLSHQLDSMARWIKGREVDIVGAAQRSASLAVSSRKGTELINVVESNSSNILNIMKALVETNNDEVSPTTLLYTANMLLEHHVALTNPKHISKIVMALPDSLRTIIINSSSFTKLLPRIPDATFHVLECLRNASQAFRFRNRIINEHIRKALLYNHQIELGIKVHMNPLLPLTLKSVDIFCRALITHNTCPSYLLQRFYSIFGDRTVFANVQLNKHIHDGNYDHASHFFDSIPAPDAFTQNLQIRMYAQLYSQPAQNPIHLKKWTDLLPKVSLQTKNAFYCTLFSLIDPNAIGDKIELISRFITSDMTYFYNRYQVSRPIIRQYEIALEPNLVKRMQMYRVAHGKRSIVVLRAIRQALKSKRDPAVEQDLEGWSHQAQLVTNSEAFDYSSRRTDIKPFQPDTIKFIFKEYIHSNHQSSLQTMLDLQLQSFELKQKKHFMQLPRELRDTIRAEDF